MIHAPKELVEEVFTLRAAENRFKSRERKYRMLVDALDTMLRQKDLQRSFDTDKAAIRSLKEELGLL